MHRYTTRPPPCIDLQHTPSSPPHTNPHVYIQCTYDRTPGAVALRSNRVRAYNTFQSQDACTFWTSWVTYLIIDNLTYNDSGEYACNAQPLEASVVLNTSQTIVLTIGKWFIIKFLKHAYTFWGVVYDSVEPTKQAPVISKTTASTMLIKRELNNTNLLMCMHAESINTQIF